MGRFARILIVASAMLMCCGPNNVEPHVPDAPPGPDDNETDFCDAACDRWVGLGCGDAVVCTRFEEPSDRCVESISCSKWCERIIVEASEGVVFHPRCVAMTEPPAGVSDACSWLDQACAGAAP
jgi:hypothetical protein